MARLRHDRLGAATRLPGRRQGGPGAHPWARGWGYRRPHGPATADDGLDRRVGRRLGRPGDPGVLGADRDLAHPDRGVSLRGHRRLRGPFAQRDLPAPHRPARSGQRGRAELGGGPGRSYLFAHHCRGAHRPHRHGLFGSGHGALYRHRSLPGIQLLTLPRAHAGDTALRERRFSQLCRRHAVLELREDRPVPGHDGLRPRVLRNGVHDAAAGVRLGAGRRSVRLRAGRALRGRRAGRSSS